MKEQFDIPKIEQALRGFQREFDAINERLSLHREPVTDKIIENKLAAYAFLNDLLARDIDLFSIAGLHSLLELNHIVLCGNDMKTRLEYHKHIVDTRTRFHKRIKKIRKWVLAQFEEVDPYTLAAGFYCKALSQPQLFFEGNHRTENIVVNYLLVCQEHPPLIVSEKNAYDYLELSGKIKFTNKELVGSGGIKLKRHRKAMAKLLNTCSDPSYIINP